MEFNLAETVDVLRRTPAVLETLLNGLSKEWLEGNEGDSTWIPSWHRKIFEANHRWTYPYIK